MQSVCMQLFTIDTRKNYGAQMRGDCLPATDDRETSKGLSSEMALNDKLVDDAMEVLLTLR